VLRNLLGGNARRVLAVMSNHFGPSMHVTPVLGSFSLNGAKLVTIRAFSNRPDVGAATNGGCAEPSDLRAPCSSITGLIPAIILAWRIGSANLPNCRPVRCSQSRRDIPVRNCVKAAAVPRGGFFMSGDSLRTLLQCTRTETPQIKAQPELSQVRDDT
jgi:hypothetical protein